MTGTMRGVCKMGPGPGAEYRTDLPIPQITEDQVLMKIHATAICGTDLHLYAWNEYASKIITLEIKDLFLKNPRLSGRT